MSVEENRWWWMQRSLLRTQMSNLFVLRNNFQIFDQISEITVELQVSESSSEEFAYFFPQSYNLKGKAIAHTAGFHPTASSAAFSRIVRWSEVFDTEVKNLWVLFPANEAEKQLLQQQNEGCHLSDEGECLHTKLQVRRQEHLCASKDAHQHHRDESLQLYQAFDCECLWHSGFESRDDNALALLSPVMNEKLKRYTNTFLLII